VVGARPNLSATDTVFQEPGLSGIPGMRQGWLPSHRGSP